MNEYLFSYRIVCHNPVTCSHYLYLDRVNFDIFLLHYMKKYVIERRSFVNGQYEKIYRYNDKIIAIEECYLPDEDEEDSGRMEE